MSRSGGGDPRNPPRVGRLPKGPPLRVGSRSRTCPNCGHPSRLLLSPDDWAGGCPQCAERSEEKDEEEAQPVDWIPRPPLPDDPGRLYATILARIRTTLVGADEAAERLALSGMKFRRGSRGERILLIGPTGAGKTTATTALARALGVPHLQLNISSMSQTGWHGRSLAEALGELVDEVGSVEKLNDALLLLEEVDKLVTHHLQTDRTEFSYRQGKQINLLGLLGGATEVPVVRSLGRDLSWKNPGALVVMTGVFPDLKADPVRPEDMISLGLMPEFVSRIGTIIRLHRPNESEMIEILRLNAEPLHDLCTDLGYPLKIEEKVYRRLARVVSDRSQQVDPRTGITWLRDAVDRELLRAVQEGWPEGRTLVVDEVRVPRSSRRGSRANAVGFGLPSK